MIDSKKQLKRKPILAFIRLQATKAKSSFYVPILGCHPVFQASPGVQESHRVRMEAESIFTRWWILIIIPEDNLRGTEEVLKQQGRKKPEQANSKEPDQTKTKEPDQAKTKEPEPAQM